VSVFRASFRIALVKESLNKPPQSSITLSKRLFPFAAAGLLQMCGLLPAAMAVDPGTVDSTFNSSITGAGRLPNAILVQPNGKIIVGGVFSLVGGVEHSCIVRLNADGSVDTSFNAQADAEVSVLALQTDGKILLGGYFGKVDGTVRVGIARVNADGTLDTTFDPGSGAGTSNSVLAPSIAVKAIAVQSDKKIVIGGTFDHFDGVAHSGLARLNSHGSLDGSFAPVVTENEVQDNQVTILAIVIQPDGKIVFGGGFEAVNGSAFSNLARLNSDGTLDPAFVSDGPDSIGSINFANVTAIALQSDGKIVLGGGFRAVHGTVRKSVARFNADGSLDTAFNPGTLFTYDVFGVNDVAVQSDGKIVITGGFSTTSRGGNQQNSIFRVDSDGSLDNSFSAITSRGIYDGFGDNFQVSRVAILSNGQLIIGGDFSLVDGVKAASYARLNADGSLDSAFQTQVQGAGFVFDLVVQAGGKILAGGEFENVNGMPSYALARINSDGSLDPDFAPDFGLGPADNVGVTVSLWIQHLAVESDGKILYSAFERSRSAPFAQVDFSNPFRRLNADGSRDTTFSVTFDSSSSFVTSIVPQADGKILIAGNFSSVNGVARASFARLNANGSLDTNFQPPALMGVGPSGTPATAQITKMVVQSDGKIVLGGTFSLTNTTKPVDVVRLNSDGSLDSAFTAALPLVEDQSFQQPSVLDVALQGNGKILVAGDFSLATLNKGGDFLRLNSDGSLDNSFNGLRGTQKILPQADGKILVGGSLTQINGVPYSGLARVNADGSVDTSFLVTLNDRSRYVQVPNFVYAVGVEADGKIVLGGIFDLVDDRTHTALVRLEGDSGSRLLNISTRLAIGTGENVLIGGFIVTGTDPKTVLIRGIGPSLGRFGIAGALQDPTLELHQGGTTLATNDNWKINDHGQSQEAGIRATILQPTNDLESAILATLNPGAYTAIVAGKNGTTGIGLVEVYDLAAGANSQLANISTRGFVDTGDKAMIGGLIVGSGKANVGGIANIVVRALGPSLSAFGIADALTNPTLELHDGNGTIIATNDNWKLRPNGSSQQAEIAATNLQPHDDRESALVESVGPGNYTAIVRGAGNTTGVGLVEVYALQ
jgi:uncharacterized delta-60 repeat protein